MQWQKVRWLKLQSELKLCRFNLPLLDGHKGLMVTFKGAKILPWWASSILSCSIQQSSYGHAWIKTTLLTKESEKRRKKKKHPDTSAVCTLEIFKHSPLLYHNRCQLSLMWLKKRAWFFLYLEPSLSSRSVLFDIKQRRDSQHHLRSAPKGWSKISSNHLSKTFPPIKAASTQALR